MVARKYKVSNSEIIRRFGRKRIMKLTTNLLEEETSIQETEALKKAGDRLSDLVSNLNLLSVPKLNEFSRKNSKQISEFHRILAERPGYIS